MKIAVLLYLYDITFWYEIKNLLAAINKDISLFISVYKKSFDKNIINEINDIFDVRKISLVDNHGVDIAPFLKQIRSINQKEFPFFVKIHSKKSKLHTLEWKYLLIDSLIGSKKIFDSNIKLINKDKNIGAINCKPLIMDNVSHHKKKLNELENLIGCQITKSTVNFMAGNIFIGRTEIFKKYITDDFIFYVDKKLENGIVKDVMPTYCHATERLFGSMIKSSKCRIEYPRISPAFQIYNAKNDKLYDIYVCYNMYCHNNTMPMIYGKINQITGCPKKILIDWGHLDIPNSFIYQEVSPGIFTRI